MNNRARSVLARLSPDQIEACRAAANMAEAVARTGLDRITIEYVRKRLRRRGCEVRPWPKGKPDQGKGRSDPRRGRYATAHAPPALPLQRRACCRCGIVTAMTKYQRWCHPCRAYLSTVHDGRV